MKISYHTWLYFLKDITKETLVIFSQYNAPSFVALRGALGLDFSKNMLLVTDTLHILILGRQMCLAN